MKTILFQGDSITDAGRDREQAWDLGKGYPNLLGAEIGYRYPEQYTVLNRGISGNRVTDLLARWKIDCLNLKPDILSLMIGVNDVWHELGNQNGVETERFEMVYRMLLDDVQKLLPDTKIILMEPYVVKGAATEGEWEEFSTNVAEKREAVRRIAKAYKLPLVPLQEVFDHASETVPSTYWSADGVHPTPAGHELIARAWMKEFEKMQA